MLDHVDFLSKIRAIPCDVYAHWSDNLNIRRSPRHCIVASQRASIAHTDHELIAWIGFSTYRDTYRIRLYLDAVTAFPSCHVSKLLEVQVKAMSYIVRT